MEPSEEMKFCSNCKRDIAASNFVMHDVHCHRNIVLCSSCQEPVPRSDLDAHNEENHSEVECGLCHVSVEKPTLTEHMKSDCSKRLLMCSYCEVDKPKDALAEHENYCGTRTESCPLCQQYIMIRDMNMHEETVCQYPEPVSSSQGEAQTFGLHRLNTFVRGEMSRMVDVPMVQNDLYGRQKNLSQIKSDKNRCAEQIYAGREPPSIGSDDLDDDTLLAMQLSYADEETEGAIQNNHGFDRSKTKLPCEYCYNLFTSNDLIQHESGCSDRLTEEESGASLTQQSFPDNSGEYVDTQSWLVNSYPDEFTSSDDIMLPCEFCTQPFPMEYLFQHQAVCDLNRTQTPRHPHRPMHRNPPAEAACSNKSTKRQQDPNLFSEETSRSKFTTSKRTLTSSPPKNTSRPQGLVTKPFNPRHRPTDYNPRILDTNLSSDGAASTSSHARRSSEAARGASTSSHARRSSDTARAASSGEPNFVTTAPRQTQVGLRNDELQTAPVRASRNSNGEVVPTIQPRNNFKSRPKRKPST